MKRGLGGVKYIICTWIGNEYAVSTPSLDSSKGVVNQVGAGG